LESVAEQVKVAVGSRKSNTPNLIVEPMVTTGTASGQVARTVFG
jgi:hypothetical protein